MNAQFIGISLILATLLSFRSEGQIEVPFKSYIGTDCYMGLKNLTGKEILAPSYKKIEVAPVGNYWLISARAKSQNSYYLYTPEKTNALIYPEVSKINDRWLKVGHTGEYGIISTEGKGILLMNYSEILSAGSSMAITKHKNKFGAIDASGKSIIPNKYKDIKFWEYGGFWVKKDRHFQLVDEEGKEVAGTQCDSVCISEAPLPYCGIMKDKKWGIINKSGEIIFPLNFQSVKLLKTGNIALQQISGQWVLTDIQSRLIEGQEYSGIKSAGLQTIIVDKNYKKGLINKAGKTILMVEHEEISEIGKDWLRIKDNGSERIFIINENKFSGESTFEEIKKVSDRGSGILIKKDNKWGWMNYNKEIMIEPTYKSATPGSFGTILITGENNMTGIISDKGEIIIPLEYKVIIPKDGYFKVKKEDSGWYYVNNKNEKVHCQVY